MGYRSHITIVSKDADPITLYGHWSNTLNEQAVRNVLARTDRIGDHAYLTAQIFWEFAQLSCYDGEIGLGIWAGTSEGVWFDAPTIIVNADTGEYCREGEETNYEYATEEVQQQYGQFLIESETTNA